MYTGVLCSCCIVLSYLVPLFLLSGIVNVLFGTCIGANRCGSGEKYVKVQCASFVVYSAVLYWMNLRFFCVWAMGGFVCAVDG